MNDELRPCPFCGGPTVIVSGGWVMCQKWHTYGKCLNEIMAGSTKLWNKRPIEDAQAERIKELEAACRAALASIGETERLTWASDLYKQLTEAVGGEI